MRKEAQRQEYNDNLRQEFAQAANSFHAWLSDTRYDEQVCLRRTVDDKA